MNLLQNTFQLFYPEICIGCNNHLYKNEIVLCANCRHQLPLIKTTNYQNNEITAIFYGRTPIQKAVSFLYLKKEGITKQLILHLKYKKTQNIGTFIGHWFGTILHNSNEFCTIDYIIPVPLHPDKLRQRGYNQLTCFGKTLGKILNIKFSPFILKRISNTKTQTVKKRFERFSNGKTKFNLSDLTIFENKHILLIDDVITTGATLEACCKELQKTNNIHISIATMAFTSKK